jgi:hypothetical protein
MFKANSHFQLNAIAMRMHSFQAIRFTVIQTILFCLKKKNLYKHIKIKFNLILLKE